MDNTARTIPIKGAQNNSLRCWEAVATAVGGGGNNHVAVAPTSKFLPAAASIKDQARKGIPAQFRADAWYLLTGALELQGAHAPNYYTALSASTSELPEEVVYSVEEDVRNTHHLFRQHSKLFSSAKGAECLSRILLAFVQRGQGGCYLRGMAHVAALMLTVFGKDREEHAFWTMSALFERKLYAHCKGEVSQGSKIEVMVLQHLLEEKAPALAAEIAKLGPEVLEQLTGHWFSSAFTRVLPFDVVLRIWDCLFVEGSKVALRVAIALLKTCAGSIQSCQSVPVLLRVVEGRLARTTDAEALLVAAFKGVGSFGGAHVEAVRARVQLQVQAQQAAARARLNTLLTAPAGPVAAASSAPNSSSSPRSRPTLLTGTLSRAGSRSSSTGRGTPTARS